MLMLQKIEISKGEKEATRLHYAVSSNDESVLRTLKTAALAPAPQQNFCSATFISSQTET